MIAVRMMGLLVLGAVIAVPASAQQKSSTGHTLKETAIQPARDVGLSKTKIPPVLIAATKAPYSLTGLNSCPQLASATHALNAVLGPDFAPGNAPAKRSLLETGGAAIDSLMPFRGIIREVSGAASADRRLRAATEAGVARRGFLRGVYQTKGCGTKM